MSDYHTLTEYEKQRLNGFMEKTLQPLKDMQKPKRVMKPYEGKFWAQFELYEREQFIEEVRMAVKQLPQDAQRFYCELYHAPTKLIEIVRT